MTALMLYTVSADRNTGIWAQESLHKTGRYVDKAEWGSKIDNEFEHFDTFEVDGETCAVVVAWQ